MTSAEAPQLDLLELGLLPPIPTAFLEGRDTDLLAPLRFLASGESPTGTGPRIDRAELAAALVEANRSLGHRRAVELGTKLADPETLVVITGQQPGLGGGPLYTLSKALTAAKWAERLEGEGRAAVAVFWVASEDHDFAEITQMALAAPGGLERLELGPDPSALHPVGPRSLGSQIEDLLGEWRSTTNAEGYLSWLDRVEGRYRPEATFAQAFCGLLVDALDDHCPLLADAMLPEIKRAQSPHLLRLIDERDRIDAALVEADGAIAQRGYPLQVRPQPGTSPLFLLQEGERRRIEWRGREAFGLRGVEAADRPVEELRQISREEPGRLSPGVLARPALQDAVFGTHLHVLGPGEVSYFPQAAPVYACLDVEGPWISARPQMLVMPGRLRGRMESSGLDLGALVMGRVDGDAIVQARAGEDFVGPVLQSVEEELSTLREPILELDRSLEKPLEKTLAQVQRGLETFSHKVAAASARRHEVERNRIAALVEMVRPGGTLQERVVAGAHFVGRHQGFVERAHEQLGLDSRTLYVIDPDRAASDSGRE